MKKNKLILLAPLSSLLLSACGAIQYPSSDYILTYEHNREDFTILQLTDLHLGEKDNLKTHYDFMNLTINDAHPDFIIITGDLFTFASRSTAKSLFSYLDSWEIPWTVNFGNHDEQCYFSVEWLTGYLNRLNTKRENSVGEKKDSYCYFKDIQTDKIHGNSNFAINVMLDDDLYQQLIIMDSNRYDFKSMYYDCFRQDQIKWYEDLINYTSAEYQGSESLMFYHIPLPEINDAYEKGAPIESLGSWGEKACPPKEDPGFFEVIKGLGHTKAMFFGHDHDNDYGRTYEGVDFVYGTKSTDRVYYTEGKLGGLKIHFNENRERTYELIHHTYEELEDK